MKKIALAVSAIMLLSQLAAEVKIAVKDGNISADNGSVSFNLQKKNNHIFNLNGKDKDGKNFNAILQCFIWYHGRSGNLEHIYHDQDECEWKPVKQEIDGNIIRTFTGNVDFNVIREVEFFNDTDAIRFEYILTFKESREMSHISHFPLIRATKEIESVSFDDGTLEKFSTSTTPAAKDLIRSRALLLHMPARGKTLLMLTDINTPLKYGHKFGSYPSYNHGSAKAWCRSIGIQPLYTSFFNYYNAGDKVGVKVYFKMLDGGTLTAEHQAAARDLAKKMKVEEAKYSPKLLDDTYRTASAKAAMLNGLPGVNVWSEIPLKRVYPAMQMPANKPEKVTLTSAANEWESIQIVLNPEKDVQLQGIKFSDLTADNGTRIKAEKFYANLLGVEKTSSAQAIFYGDTTFPDKLIPLPESLPAKLQAKSNHIIHLTFFAPPGTPKGIYKGNVTLTVSGKNCTIPVELKVWGFELPKVSRYVAHGLLWDSLPEHREELLKTLSIRYRMNATVYHGGQTQLREIFDGKELRFKDNMALPEKALKEFNMPMFNAPYLFMGAWDWKPGKKVHFLGLNIDSPEFDEKYKNYLSSLYRQVKAKGLVDRTFIYMWDEMTGGHYAAMKKTVEMAHQYAPGIKMMTVSAPDPMVIKYNEIITTGPIGHWLNKDSKTVVDKALKEGREFWIYLNGTTFSHQAPPTVPRVTTWQCYAYGFTGYLQWAMDTKWKNGSFERNGDIWILYPGYEKPIYSARLEYFRDGIEDFNMFYLSKDLPPEAKKEVDDLIALVAPVLKKMNYDPILMYETRNKIGDIIDKHSK